MAEQLKDNFNFSEHALKPDEDPTNKMDKLTIEEPDKAKYDKSAGFFDMISNST